jgi:hypothetical protein
MVGSRGNQVQVVFENDVAVQFEVSILLQPFQESNTMSTASGRVKTGSHPAMVQVMKYGYSVSKMR